MKIQRYLLRNGIGEPFGKDFTRKDTYDWRWYFGERGMGIRPNPSTESEEFYHGFLVADDELLIRKHDKNPAVTRARKNGDYRGMISHDQFTKIDNLNKLIDIILSQEETPVYLTSEYQHGEHPRILTFSRIKPSDELYVPGKILPVRLVQEIINSCE